MGKEHSHDTTTVENNSFIEYSCTTFKEVHSPERINWMTFKYTLHLEKKSVRLKLTYDYL